MKIKLSLILILLASSCATTQNDPLKNTKKLVREGHIDLYNNGAIEIPLTKVKLIEPGPGMIDLGLSLAGAKVRDSFLMNIKKAASSVNLVKAGTLKSWDISKKIHLSSGEVSSFIHDNVNEDVSFLISKSVKLPEKSWISSVKLSKKLIGEMREASSRLEESSRILSENLKNDIVLSGKSKSLQWRRNLKKFETSSHREAKKFDRDFRKKGEVSSQSMRDSSKMVSKEMIDSAKKVNRIAERSGKEKDIELSETADRFYDNFSESSDELDQKLGEMGIRSEVALFKSAKRLSKYSGKIASTHLSYAKNGFIKGYSVFPQNLSKNIEGVEKSLSSFGENFKNSEKTRKKLSDKMTVIWNDSFSSIGKDTEKNWNNAKNVFAGKSSSIGYTLGSFKAVAWLTRMIFWDSLIKPIGNASIGGLGYLAVNSVIYPSMLVYESGKSTTKLLVKVSKTVIEGVYDLTAPSVSAAVASVISLSSYTSGKIGSAFVAASAKPTHYGLKLTGKTIKYLGKVAGKSGELVLKASGKLVKGASYSLPKPLLGVAHVLAPASSVALKATSVATEGGSYLIAKGGKYFLKGASSSVRLAGVGGAHIVQGASLATGSMAKVITRGSGKIASKSINYIGVPVTALGVTAGSTALGVASAAVGASVGSSYYVAGQSASAATFVFGNTLAAGTLAVGTSASVATGAAVSAYELGKSITVPSGYLMGSGIVLSYGAASQLAAQSILAVSDAAYLVLSLEGPRWVVYAVSGKLGKGEDLPTGTVLDLEKMQSSGEEFKVVPATSKELKKVIEAVGTGK